MFYVKDMYHDEIRKDFLVKADRKKIWNRQLEIWAQVDRICRKHDITYWAAYGTLLGAARHKGFIPWDDDLDICMMRPEYNRFVQVLADELKADGGLFVAQNVTFSFTKLFHTQTTLFAKNADCNKPWGLLVDVFALDILEDGTPESFFATAALKELNAVSWNPSLLKDCDGSRNDLAFLKEVSAFGEEDKFKVLALYAENLFDQSRNVEWFDDTVMGKYKQPFRKEWFDETIYLPFETVELPAPKMFDEVLTSYYGDWRTPVHDGQPRLGIIHSPDIPYEEFFRLVNVDDIFNKKIQGGLNNWFS